MKLPVELEAGSERRFPSRAAATGIALGLVLGLCLGPGLAGCGRGDGLETLAEEHAGDRGDAPGAARIAADADRMSGREVVYGRDAAGELNGYLAEAGPGAPGVLVIHEWWGLNDNIRTWTRQLAAEGYTALAVDLYGGRVAESALEARMLVREALDQVPRLEANLREAHGFLRDRLAAPRIGVIGWCFGGGWSLRTALLLGDEIDAAVVYYGQLETGRDRLQSLEAPLLGIFAGRDRSIPVESVRLFQETLESLGKPATLRVYEEADHAFANPSGERFDEEAALDAWRRTREFLREHLAVGAAGAAD